jgi:hypothetical protein
VQSAKCKVQSVEGERVETEDGPSRAIGRGGIFGDKLAGRLDLVFWPSCVSLSVAPLLSRRVQFNFSC